MRCLAGKFLPKSRFLPTSLVDLNAQTRLDLLQRRSFPRQVDHALYSFGRINDILGTLRCVMGLPTWPRAACKNDILHCLPMSCHSGSVSAP
jgi:hypothetical protein